MDKLLGFAIRLGGEVTRPNAVAALFLVGAVASELSILVMVLMGSNPTLVLAAFCFCVGGYAGSLRANWRGGDR